MKNKYLKIKMSIMALMLLVTSCSKTELVPIASHSPSNKKNNGNEIKSAGDGVWDLLGYGYDVTGEYANSSASKFSVIDIARLKVDYPTRVETDLASRKYGEIIGGENATSYLSNLTDKVGASASIPEGDIPKTAPADGKNLPIPLFKLSIQNSFDNTDNFSSKYVYSNYSLKIQQKRLKVNAELELMKQYLQPSFISDVQNASPQQIVASYGTHVLKDIILGAKLSVHYRAETNSSDRKTAATKGLDINVLGIFGINTSQTTTTQTTTNNTNWKLVFETIGGEPSASLSGTATAGLVPSISTVAWENSSSVNNAEIIDFAENGLIPIWELITDIGKAKAVKDYVIQYLKDRQARPLGDVPIYVYNNPVGDHYFTPDNQSTIGNGAFTNEGIAFYAHKIFKEGSVPIYVYYNAGGSDHYFTPDNQPTIGNGSFRNEGIAFYAYKTAGEDRVPIYVYYSAVGSDHYFTPDNQPTIGNGNFRNEGIAFYAYAK